MNWIETFTGKAVDFDAVKAGDICIEDVAHALGNLCRFVGHTREFYSVAQHSVLVSLGSAPYPVHGLLHDAAEAYIGDLSYPLKQYFESERQTAALRKLETDLNGAIAESLGVPDFAQWDAKWKPIVKRADLRALATERRDLMPDTKSDWPLLKGIDPFVGSIVPLDPRSATELFLNRWHQLMQAQP